VIRRLRDDAAGATVAAGNAGPEAIAADSVGNKRESPRDLFVADRVVSLAAIDGRLDGIRRLIARRDAVITPSVKDEMRQRRIELIRGDEPPAVSAGCSRAALAVVGEPAGQLIAELEPFAARVDRFAAGGLLTAVRHLTRQVTNGDSLGVLLTPQPVAAQYLANCVDGIRAAWAVDDGTLREATDAIGANLLVIDAKRGTPAATASLVQQFVAAGHRPRPAALAEMVERVR
jgi:hypothetical protein